jgi:hypothetical protein
LSSTGSLGQEKRRGKRWGRSWCNSYHLLDGKGIRSRREARRVGLLYFPVGHPHFPGTPLWLVVARPKGLPALHFLTNEPIHTKDDAWRIVFAYRRRWQVETAFRLLKTELALESPRLWFWHNRLKHFALVALLYAFLVSLIVDRRLLDYLFTN